MLLKQERSEAVMAVDGRLEFIEREMYVLPILTMNRAECGQELGAKGL